MIYISFENCKILSENETCACDSIVSSNKGKGRLSSFTYNALGQVTSKVTVIGAKTYTTSFTYSLNGKLTQITYPSGRIVIVARNVVGQASSVTTKQTSVASAVNVATAMTYQPMSNLLNSLTHGKAMLCRVMINSCDITSKP